MENNNGNFLTNINNEKDILSYIAQKLTFLDVIAQNMNLIEYNLNKRIDAIEINNKKEMIIHWAFKSNMYKECHKRQGKSHAKVICLMYWQY